MSGDLNPRVDRRGAGSTSATMSAGLARIALTQPAALTWRRRPVYRPELPVIGVGRALPDVRRTRGRIAVAAGSVVLAVAGLSVSLAAPAHSQAVQEGALAALLVAAGTAAIVTRASS